MKALFGAAAAREALLGHEFATPGSDLDLRESNPIHHAFPDVVKGDYDLAELSIVAFLQAVDAGQPLSILPVTLLGRFQHHTLVTLDRSGGLTADRLEGRRVGVRSWAQTTAVWVRGFLGDDHGIDVSKVDWVVYENGHLPGLIDPSYVSRAPAGAKLGQDLLSATVAAAIMGNDLPDDDRIETVLPDPAREAAAWYGRTGAIPLNHIVVARDDFAEQHSDLVAEVCGVIARAMPAAPRISSTPNYYPSGFAALASSLDLAGRYAFEQGLVSRPISAAELREKTERLVGRDLGDLASEAPAIA